MGYLLLSPYSMADCSACVEIKKTEAEVFSAALFSTAPGALARRQLCQESEIKRSSFLLPCLSIIATSVAWILAFVVSQKQTDALPWTVLLAALCAAALSWLWASRRIDALSIFRFGEQRRGTFTDSFAASFATLSAILAAWVAFHHYHPAPPELVRRQVMDIELVSLTDFQDHKDPLPETRENQEERKQVAMPLKSISTMPTAVALKSAVVLPSPPAPEGVKQLRSKPSQKEVQAPRKPVPPKHEQQTAGEEQFRYVITDSQEPGRKPQIDKPDQRYEKLAPSLLSTRQSPPALQKSHEEPLLQEVAPPEMVELTENEGESKGRNIFQAGGHSSGGEGAQTALVPYLKDVHHRIKRAWSPPAHDTRSAQILFRIKRNGRLASIKLVNSSGSSDNDESAMAAITASAPFKPLPADYSPSFLDLLYTFNLNIDELSEAPGSSL
ncbi:MAG TPA: TonB C-terminal domain-containing protein [Chroococcales cyanobacterium]